ncbi:uncharacterized protein IL334_007079 [Kwoniella shivajii]|uniref:DNA polymerase lambda n=1 Tax=Kwoniella shivajii TaxID=564305 RepID=A0ABZ1D9S9_9TREE|nr:hypothetical protein IL334_007079 [Kwoniella shivajii]
MARPIVFKSHKRDFWSVVDASEEEEDLKESRDQVDSFFEQVKEEIAWKNKQQLVSADSTDTVVQAQEDVEIQSDSSTASQSAEVLFSPLPVEEAIGKKTVVPIPVLRSVISDLSEVSFIPPSFHPSHILQTSTPRAPTSTFPSVPTPSDAGTPRLPAPASWKLHSLPLSSRSADPATPDYVASPIDSPSTTKSRLSVNPSGVGEGEGRGRRDDPETPVPIGKSALSEIKSRKDHQAISKHFDLLSRAVVKGQPLPQGKVKGKQTLGKAATMTAGIGGKVFDALKFCLTSEVNQASKLKQRADIITSLGGQVVLQPDTAITHVIYDTGKSASLLAQKLGVETLSELPEGTTCVKWDWIVQCKLAGRLLDPTPWLSFPKTSFSRAVSTNAIRPTSRIFDITDQLRGQSVAITRKREPTASDSDTEESSKKRSRIGQTKSFTLFPPVPERCEENANAKSGPSRLKSMDNLDISVATEHALPSGPGWKTAAEGERDALDEMIEGIVKGSLDVPEDIDENSDREDGSPERRNRSDTNPNPSADGYKCGQNHDGKGYTGPNEWLAKKFEELHDLYSGQVGKNSFAIRGYQRAAGIMRRITYPITTGTQARAIPGIGMNLADRIDEFLSGAQGRAFYENTEQARCVALFKDIYGVGRQHANEMYRSGARTIDDLRSGKFSLTAGQMIGLQLYDDLKARIPRDECKDIFEIIRSEAQAIDDQLWVEIMGSYRRGQDTSGDVDILITREGGEDNEKKGILGDLIQRLKRKGLVTHDLGTPTDWTAPEAKWMGVGRLSSAHKHRRIDILCIPYKYWGAALIYFTGNEVFNRSMRLYARKNGYSLNQRGLYKGVIRGKDGLKQTEGELIASKTEQDIFNMLGLRWRHPHHRRP